MQISTKSDSLLALVVLQIDEVEVKNFNCQGKGQKIKFFSFFFDK
jgi:hypothetical protein